MQKLHNFNQIMEILHFFTKHIDIIELQAFLGLLYVTGVFKSPHEDASSLWDTDCTGRDMFRCIKSLKRFLFLFTTLRFDDAETGPVRKVGGGTNWLSYLNCLRYLVNICKDNDTSYAYTTVDEILVKFRSKCSFRVYIMD